MEPLSLTSKNPRRFTSSRTSLAGTLRTGAPSKPFVPKMARIVVAIDPSGARARMTRAQMISELLWQGEASTAAVMFLQTTLADYPLEDGESAHTACALSRPPRLVPNPAFAQQISSCVAEGSQVQPS